MKGSSFGAQFWKNFFASTLTLGVLFVVLIQPTFAAEVPQSQTCCWAGIENNLCTGSLSLNKKVLYGGSEYDSLDAGTHKFAAGEMITYKIYYQNGGSDTVYNVMLVDQLPTYLLPVSYGGASWNGTSLTFNIGTLGVGFSGSVQYSVTVHSNVPAGDTTQTNIAQITANNTTTTYSDASSVVVTGAFAPQTSGITTFLPAGNYPPPLANYPTVLATVSPHLAPAVSGVTTLPRTGAQAFLFGVPAILGGFGWQLRQFRRGKMDGANGVSEAFHIFARRRQNLNGPSILG